MASGRSSFMSLPRRLGERRADSTDNGVPLRNTVENLGSASYDSKRETRSLDSPRESLEQVRASLEQIRRQQKAPSRERSRDQGISPSTTKIMDDKEKAKQKPKRDNALKKIRGLCPCSRPYMSLEDRLLLSPWQKWRKYSRVPWKIALHFLLFAVMATEVRRSPVYSLYLTKFPTLDYPAICRIITIRTSIHEYLLPSFPQHRRSSPL